MASGDIDTKLYAGTQHVQYKDSSHRYKVNGVAKKSVTTILSAVIAKPGLATWPLDMAIKFLRDKCPIITEDDLKEAEKQYIIKRDAGAGTGGEAHALVEQWLRALPTPQPLTAEDIVGDESAISQEAQNAFMAFLEWCVLVKPTVLGIEQVVYSDEYSYAGCYDFLLEIDGQVILGDLKTTNAGREAKKGVYPENFLQLGAYAWAYEEERLFEMANGGSTRAPIDDLMIVSCRKDGTSDVVKASGLGLSVNDCMMEAKRVIKLHSFLDRVKKALK